MLTPCSHCPAWLLCKKRGCYAWNGAAREKIDADLKKLDAVPELRVNPWAWWRGAPSMWQRREG